MKCVLLLLMFSICIPQNNSEYILATNDGEFLQITSYSKEEDGMLVWQKTSSIVSAKHKVIPYSQIKNIKDRNGNVVWDKDSQNIEQRKKITFPNIFSWDTFKIGYGNNRLQSATFQKNNIIYGMDFLHLSLSTNTNYTDLDTDDFEGKITLNVFMPRLGYIKKAISSNKVNAYNQIESYLIFPQVLTSGDIDLDVETHDQIEDAIDLLGFKASHVVEYMFTDQFSLSADVGINWIVNNVNTKSSDANTEMKAMLGMTYSKISLKFTL